ncbi:hypothetical protein ACH79_27210 [Bradyrhizobium sp. CCBAU 051011]|uniref:hypothetical protein n=1 Tax=Bradyrhizobium sp. CCBAU 051011 TaxID=858422 RepID=UPI001374093C|nr:hypothetical protein [Bradyrhizobium sp. CCBAU 051011]QHO75758.1 hypothetical protein ACH79_27210 [Bradyrhizobium sp. CCBAU 051011]
MITRNLLVAATALSLVALPAMAQTEKTDTETTGHHYSGGPRSDPHHMGKKKHTGVTTGKAGPRGSHHYSGGPRSDPHHIGPK